MSKGPPSTAILTVTYADAVSGYYAVAFAGQIFEACDPKGIAPAVGNIVLADYLPFSSQWELEAIIT